MGDEAGANIPVVGFSPPKFLACIRINSQHPGLGADVQFVAAANLSEDRCVPRSADALDFPDLRPRFLAPSDEARTRLSRPTVPTCAGEDARRACPPATR